MNSLRRQLDASQEELAGLRREKEITVRENRRLQDDLATMTRENQVNKKITITVINVESSVSCTKIIEVTLATCIFFVQAVHAEMEESLHEKDELKLRLHSYISEVARVEKLIATKARTYPCAHVFFVCGFTHIIITWKPL